MRLYRGIAVPEHAASLACLLLAPLRHPDRVGNSPFIGVDRKWRSPGPLHPNFPRGGPSRPPPLHSFKTPRHTYRTTILRRPPLHRRLRPTHRSLSEKPTLILS